MMQSCRSAALAFVCVLAGWACSAAGYGIGAAADSGNRVRFAPSTGQPAPFASGQRVKIVQKDGSVIEATYRGIHATVESEEAGSPSVPTGSVVRFEERGREGTRDIPTEAVALIESAPRSGRTVGLVMGALLDLAGLIATIANPPGAY